jgi:hypothetical protein
MLKVIRVLLHPCQVVLGCCLSVLESVNDCSFSSKDTVNKALDGDCVFIQIDKHQDFIRHKFNRLATQQWCTLQSAGRFSFAVIVSQVPMLAWLYIDDQTTSRVLSKTSACKSRERGQPILRWLPASGAHVRSLAAPTPLG